MRIEFKYKRDFSSFFCEKYCRNIAQCTDGRKQVVIKKKNNTTILTTRFGR